MTDTDKLISGLCDPDNGKAYALTLSMLSRSAASDELAGAIPALLPLLSHSSSYVRIRAFQLITAQARWGALTSEDLDTLLALLRTDKPAAVRQYLAALQTPAQAQPSLRDQLRAGLQTMDLSRFRDSMRPLIERDIAALTELL